MIYRNRKLLEACRKLPCQNCGAEDGTVAAAHRNEGKGMSLKVSDALVAALCHRCHHEIDNGKTFTREQRRACWDKAYIRTMQMLIERGYLEVRG